MVNNNFMLRNFPHSCIILNHSFNTNCFKNELFNYLLISLCYRVILLTYLLSQLRNSLLLKNLKVH
jgi:hypothetical protein